MIILNKIIEFFNGKDLTFIWEQFAKEKQGKLKSTSGDLYVDYSYNNFNYKIANFTHYINSGGRSYEKKYMIGIVEFNNPTKLELCINQEDLFTRISDFFNKKDIVIGNNTFDSKFYIKSNNKFKAISILKDKTILEKIIAMNPTRLEITDKDGLFNEVPKTGKYMLYYAKRERFKDVNQLNQIHNLLETFIDNLKTNYSIE